MQNFKLRRQCGTVYNSGNVLFSSDGNSILTIVGSRVNIYDLTNQKVRLVSA